ncbi:unnamed protein product [Prorocentrum cordatum]|nr:unnamed protein product [Polarella glacialis]
MYDRRARASSTPPALLQCAPSRQGKRAPCQDSGPGRRRLHGRRRDGLDWRREFGGGRPRVGSSSGQSSSGEVGGLLCGVRCALLAEPAERCRGTAGAPHCSERLGSTRRAPAVWSRPPFWRHCLKW